MSNTSSSIIDELSAIAEITLRFGQVFRATEDADGNPESDTTHTVMLCLTLLHLDAHQCLPKDVFLLEAIRYALVHDLPEAYAGDTSTLRALDEKAQAEKKERETKAIKRLEEDLPGTKRWLTSLHHYEEQKSRTARFVRYLDKILPKLTHALNDARVPLREGMTLPEFRQEHRAQGERLKMECRVPELDNLFLMVCQHAEAAMADELLRRQTKDPASSSSEDEGVP